MTAHLSTLADSQVVHSEQLDELLQRMSSRAATIEFDESDSMAAPSQRHAHVRGQIDGTSFEITYQALTQTFGTRSELCEMLLVRADGLALFNAENRGVPREWKVFPSQPGKERVAKYVAFAKKLNEGAAKSSRTYVQ